MTLVVVLAILLPRNPMHPKLGRLALQLILLQLHLQPSLLRRLRHGVHLRLRNHPRQQSLLQPPTPPRIWTWTLSISLSVSLLNRYLHSSLCHLNSGFSTARTFEQVIRGLNRRLTVSCHFL